VSRLAAFMGNKPPSSSGGCSPTQAIIKRHLLTGERMRDDGVTVLVFGVSMLLTMMVVQILYLKIRNRWLKSGKG